MIEGNIQDINDATKALVVWFESQDIDPGLAITVMLNLISHQIANAPRPSAETQLAFVSMTLAALVRAKKKDPAQ